MKKIFLLICILSVLILSSCDIGDIFSSTSDGFTFKKNDDGGYTVVSFDQSKTEVTVPESYSDKPVTIIGENAFYGCENLIKVTIPTSVVKIEESVFENCNNLKTISLPFVGDSLEGYSYKHLGYLFGGTSSSENSIYVPQSLKEVIITGGSKIPSRAFSDCSGLESVKLSSSIKKIGENAFDGCSSLIEITFEGESLLESIGEFSFSNCSSLTNVVIPNSVKTIGASAFVNCNSLESITLPFVGEALYRSNNLYFGFIFGATNYKLNSTYVPQSLKEVIITNSYQIGDKAFKGCSGLTSVVLASSITKIGEYAFDGCSNLSIVTFEDGSKLNTIGSYAFNRCSSLNNIQIPSSVTSISNGAFMDCSSLTTIKIPSSVKEMGNYAFSNCSNLIEVIFEKNCQLEKLNRGVFNCCSSLTSIEIPSSITILESYAFKQCSNLKIVTFEANSKIVFIEDYVFGECINLTDFEFPKGLKGAYYFAFFRCDNLTNVYYGGTEKDWFFTIIDIGNESLENANIIYEYTK